MYCTCILCCKCSFFVFLSLKCTLLFVPYKMIYWQGIYISNWWFYAEITNIKLAIFCFNLSMLNGSWHKIANMKFAN